MKLINPVYMRLSFSFTPLYFITMYSPLKKSDLRRQNFYEKELPIRPKFVPVSLLRRRKRKKYLRTKELSF